MKEEPDAKKPKLEETAAPVQQSLKIIDIDPDGDLTILFESQKTAYKIDSNALKRASPELYQQCLDVRPADGSAWVFKGVRRNFVEAIEVVLNLIHANMEQIPKPMGFGTVHVVVAFAKRYGMLDRFLGSLKQWHQETPPNCHPSQAKTSKCYRLWTAYQLGVEEDFNALQRWAIFNLSDDGKGSLGDPHELLRGKPLDLSVLLLAEKVVTGKPLRFIRT
jgi:hypothetical protein